MSSNRCQRQLAVSSLLQTQARRRGHLQKRGKSSFCRSPYQIRHLVDIKIQGRSLLENTFLILQSHHCLAYCQLKWRSILQVMLCCLVWFGLWRCLFKRCWFFRWCRSWWWGLGIVKIYSQTHTRPHWLLKTEYLVWRLRYVNKITIRSVKQSIIGQVSVRGCDQTYFKP